MTAYLWLIIIAAALIYAAISGFMKGLLSQIGQIAGLVVGVLASRALSPSLLAMLRSDAGLEAPSWAASLICHALVFLAAYFTVVLLARLIRLVVRVACLGPLDRLAGALFKILKWAIIVSIAYNFAVILSISSPPSPTDNWIERTVYKTAPTVLDVWQTSVNKSSI